MLPGSCSPSFFTLQNRSNPSSNKIKNDVKKYIYICMYVYRLTRENTQAHVWKMFHM